MPLIHQSFDTIKCDIPECKDQFTSYAGVEEFWDKGWRSEHMFDKEICMCPSHAIQLKNFLFKTVDGYRANDS